jgi:hypothetical protein
LFFRVLCLSVFVTIIRVYALRLFAFALAGVDAFGAAHLGLFRSDYLLHSVGDRLSLEQVEFNTISSSVQLLCIGMFILFVFLNSIYTDVPDIPASI